MSETATASPMQDAANRVEAALYGAGEEQSEEKEVSKDAVVDELPEDDQPDSDDEEKEVDLDDMAEMETDDDQTLASYLGIDEDKVSYDDDGNVQFKAIIDGEAKNVPMKDVIASYQLQGHVNNKSISLENERKEFESQRNTFAETYTGKVQELDSLSQVLEQQLVSDFNSVDWDRLRSESPSEWTALRQEYSEKAQTLQHIQGDIRTKAQETYDANMQENEAKQREYLQTEANKVLIDNPTWSDPTVFQEESGKIKGFLANTYGFDQQDFNMVTDSRLVKLIQDARAYREGTSSAEVKKQKKIPKFQKPGAAQKNSAQTAKARDMKARRAAVKKGGGHVQDVANLLVDRM